MKHSTSGKPSVAAASPQDHVAVFAGIDEAGRGAWAGPVVAAAVIVHSEPIVGVTDSKKLSRDERDRLYDEIIAAHIVGVGMSSAEVIDLEGIKRANFLAMQEAINSLSTQPDHLLVDGNDNYTFAIPATFIIQGDTSEYAIAAASIIAKVTRDRLMVDLSKQYHCFSFDRHMGYGTKSHQQELQTYGPTRIHRQSYRPILELKQLSLLD